jgi:hypothetical protein
MEKALKKIYYDIGHSAGFTTPNQLYIATKKKYSLKKIKNWLLKQDTYTLHKQRPLKFKRGRIYANNIGQHYQADLNDMRSISKYNKNINYLLTCIDIFSKKGWVLPLHDKTSLSVKKGFEIIFKDKKCENLMVDNGGEFKGPIFLNYLKKNNVNIFTSNNPDIKCSIVERFNRSLKSIMWKHFSYSGSYKYLNKLPEIINAYNNRKHSATKYSPNEINESNILQVYENLYCGKGRYKKNSLCPSVKPLFNVGDTVRISRDKSHFDKGYLHNFSYETFTIDKIYLRDPIVYSLIDNNNEKIKGNFYEKELSKIIITKNTEYKIDKILGIRGKKGSRMLHVRWKGYSDKFNTWIKEKELRKL